MLPSTGNAQSAAVDNRTRPRVDACQQVWVKPLAGGARAVCVVNWAPTAAVVDCPAAGTSNLIGPNVCSMALLGVEGRVTARDLVARRDLGELAALHVPLEPDGGSALFRLEPLP